jgi:putative peptide zinc metalloprotease protein
MRERLLTFLAVLTAALAFAPGAALGDDSAAVAVNTRDNSTVFRLMFDIQRVMGGTVDSTNTAAAVSSCSSCETVAIAIQVVLATGSPTVVVPENLALAMNIDCNTCQTLADAYQYVYTTGGQVHFTAEGNRQIADIRRQLEQLRNAGLPLAELQARVVELNNQLEQVLLTQLVPAGPPPGTDTSASPAPAGSGTDTTPTPTDTDSSTTPTGTDTGSSTTPTGTGTSTGTSTTPTDTGTGTSTTPGDTGTSTTPTDTGTGTSTSPSG